MKKLFKSTYETVEFPHCRQDLSRYGREVTFVFTKTDWDTLVAALPEEWQGETICGVRCADFGDESELYKKARIRFGLRFKRVVTLRLLDWLMLAQSWAQSSNEEVRGFASWIAKREFFSLIGEAEILAQNFLGLLSEEDEDELRSWLLKEFDAQRSQSSNGMLAR